MKNEKLIQKLKKEQDELEKNLFKLNSFIMKQQDSQTISDHHLNLLKGQSHVMCEYSEILGMRINDLEEHQG